MQKSFLALLLYLFLSTMATHAQTKILKGVVLSGESNEAIPGATVQIPGTGNGTVTGNDGTFSFSIPDTTLWIRISFIGMQTKEVEVRNLQYLEVVLEPTAETMDELVVVAYGARAKSSLTGAVGIVEGEQLEAVPIASFDNALQGTVAGLNVVSNSGMPGRASDITIRGINSGGAGSSPLYVVDGVPISAGDFSSINPSDIQSISVLKDASATALYGSRGATGVILVTTKKGEKAEKARISYRGASGVTQAATHKFNQMSTTQKLDYEEYLGLRTSGQYNRDSLEQTNTNWFDALTQTGKMQSHEISISGGKDNLTYYVSGGYYNESGIVPTAGFTRYSGKVNLASEATKWLHIEANTTITYEDVANSVTPERGDLNGNVFNPVFRSYLENPYTSPYRADGSYAQVEDGLFWANPLQHLELNPSGLGQFLFLGNYAAEIRFTDQLKFKTTAGIRFLDVVQSSYVSPKSAWGLETDGSVSRAMLRDYNITNTNLLMFNKTINAHKINAFIGQESYQEKTEDFGAYGEGLPNEIVDVLDATANPQSVSGNISEATMLSFMATANYSFREKLFLDAYFRYDGASRFGKNVRWAPFWSVAGMYNLGQEEFIKNARALDFLKIRMSYGINGNWQFGNYNHLALYASGPTYLDQPGGAPDPGNPGNENLTWETSRMFNTGISFGLFNKLNVDLEFYNNTTTDMIYFVPFSFTSGYGGGYDNVGDLRNTGIETTIDYTLVRTEKASWKVGMNFGYTNNRFIKLYDDREEIISDFTIQKVGESLGTFYLVRYAGVNPGNGAVNWYDKDGNVTTTYKASDAVVMSGKSSIAPWAGGFSSQYTYGGFSASVYFSWMADKWLMNNTRYFTENSDFAQYNQSAKVLDFWTQPGDIARYPDPRLTGTGQMQFDERLLEDASFMRLKELTFAYSLPAKLLQKTKALEAFKVYLTGYNLLTFTKYSGQDPEISSSIDIGNYPQVRTFSVGIEAGF